MRHEHPFDAAASRPAGAAVAGNRANLRPETVESCCFRFRPCGAALPVEQPIRCHEIAKASGQSIEPLHLCFDGAAAAVKWVDKCSGAMNVCPVEHVANADHPRIIELVIAADLTAASKAGLAGSRSARAGGNVGHVDMRKGPADVGADIAAGPNIERWRWTGGT